MSLLDNMMYGNGNGKNNRKQSIEKKTAKATGLGDPDPSGPASKEEFAKEISVDKDRDDEFSKEISVEKTTKKYETVSHDTDVTGEGAAFADKTLKRSKTTGTSFKEEFSEGFSDVSRYGIQSYSKAGVTFEKISEDQARINYSGLLAKSGASQIEGVYGFGSNQNWEGVSNLTLKKESDGSFIAVVPVQQGKNVNFAFKDTAENWDNNSGMNYTFVN